MKMLIAIPCSFQCMLNASDTYCIMVLLRYLKAAKDGLLDPRESLTNKVQLHATDCQSMLAPFHKQDGVCIH